MFKHNWLYLDSFVFKMIIFYIEGGVIESTLIII